ncbi:MAG: PAS domain-containing protein [candidate division NC10 bacterium]|nr:PAS domain-containing protein [candidate division NC10 bacterium]
MRLTILGKSVLSIGLLIAFSLTLVGVSLERRERAALVDQAIARLEAQVALLSGEVAAAVPEGDAWARRVAARTKARVTVIAGDGRVLADSDEASIRMENHATRPEVAEALAGASGHAVRFSRTVHRDLVYFAQVMPEVDGRRLVLRLAIPVGDVAHGFRQFRRDFLAIATISLAVAIGITLLWAQRITRPLRQMVGFARGVAQGEMAQRLPVRSRDELGELTEALNAMAEDLRATLRRLEEEGRRVRTIMESMAEGLLVIDAGSRISLLNPAAEALLDLKRETALGQTPLEAVRSHELHDLLKAAVERAGGASAEITLAYPRRRVLAGTAVAIRDAGGAFQGTVLALRDVTQLKRLEEARMEFVVNVSHELRTPLTAIRGYAETLLDDGLENREEARKFLEIIHRHAERLGRLLNDLLDLSNIELGRTTLHLAPTSLAEVMESVLPVIRPRAEGRRIRTIMESMAEGLMVIDGRGRISLVIPAAEALLDLKKDAALAQPSRSVLPCCG